MAFKKGISGNPGGRPKYVLPDGRTLSEVAREATEEAVAALRRVVNDPASPALAVVGAATALLDRGWGRPRQDVALDIEVNESAAAILQAARQRVRDALPDRPVTIIDALPAPEGTA